MKLSFIIPTLNADKVLDKCLASIYKQDFPKKDYQILIIDGGSTDKTLEIAKKYKSTIYSNPLKTAEAGKAVGVKKAKGKYLALIDSDNILPKKNWLNKMLAPLEENRDIIVSEPINFAYRRNSGVFERYSALIGANDPYAFVTGVYDRQNWVNKKWTGLNLEETNKKNYIEVILKPNTIIPTIGANGTIFRSSFLKNNLKSDYLFDIDIISQVLNKKKKNLLIAKVKVSIIHTFCENSFSKFIRKQKRRLTDYYIYKELRKYDWQPINQRAQLKFILYTLLFIPALIDSFRGFLNKKDWVWFLHPLLSFLTLLIYTLITLKFKLNLLKAINRQKWQQ